MKKLPIIILMLFCFGCSQSIPKKEYFELKEKAVVPYGWVDYCKRHPNDPFCKENK